MHGMLSQQFEKQGSVSICAALIVSLTHGDILNACLHILSVI